MNSLIYAIVFLAGIMVFVWGSFKYNMQQKKPGSDTSPEIQNKLVLYSYILGLGLIMMIVSIWLLIGK